MQPETRYDYSNSQRQINRLVWVIAAAVLLVGWGIWHLVNRPAPTGTVTILFNPDGLDAVNVTFNDKGVWSGDGKNYQIKPGTYTLKVTTPGYKDFSATVPVVRDQTVLVNAQLHPKTPAPLQQNSDMSWLPEDIGPVVIVNTHYFSNNNWAVLRVNTQYDIGALLVLQRDQNTNKWKTVLGPGLGFDEASVASLPTVIQQYLHDNNYVVHGD